MMDEITISEDWEQVETDSVAEWSNADGDMAIRVDEVEDELIVSLNREVSVDGYEAEISTMIVNTTTPDEAAGVVERIIDELWMGVNGVTAIGADEGDVGDETFVHFYCVFEELLPDGLTADDVTFLDDVDDDEDVAETVSSFDVEEEVEPESGVRVEIYPVHESEVTEVDE